MDALTIAFKKNKKAIRLMEDESERKMMTEFLALRPNSYLMDDSNTDKKTKGTKKCVIEKILQFNDYKNCLLNNLIILKPQQRDLKVN